MAPIQIIRGWDDDGQPTVSDLVGVLEVLRRHGCDLEGGHLWFKVATANSSPATVARLVFSAAVTASLTRFDFPLLRAAKARTTLEVSCSLSLEALDKAEVDADGNVCLTDGRWMHSLQFEPVDVPGPWTDLDEAIIWLTIKAFDAERLFMRRHFPFADVEGQPAKYRCVFIDYSILHTLHEPNVKALTRYINDNIATLPRESGKKPFQRVAISRVRSTLRIAGVTKVRGHGQTRAA